MVKRDLKLALIFCAVSLLCLWSRMSGTAHLHSETSHTAVPVMVWDKARALNGYTLITGQFGAQAFLIDMEGNVVHHWGLPFSKAWPDSSHVETPMSDEHISWASAKLLPNGDLIAVYSANEDTPYGYGLVKIDKDSHLIWKYSALAHHAFDIAADGTIYALIQIKENEPFAAVSGQHLPTLADYVAVLSGDGQEIKRISVVQAFLNSDYGSYLKGKDLEVDRMDFTRTNSIQAITPELAGTAPEFKTGEVLISLGQLNTVAALDIEQRRIAWAAQGGWRRQDSASLLPNGHILLLDNRVYFTDHNALQISEASKVLEINPHTLATAWAYAGSNTHPLHTPQGGHIERLGNGNTLIAESMSGRVFEVTPDDQIVWEYLARHQFNGILSKNDYFLIQSATRYTTDELPFMQQDKARHENNISN